MKKLIMVSTLIVLAMANTTFAYDVIVNKDSCIAAVKEYIINGNVTYNNINSSEKLLDEITKGCFESINQITTQAVEKPVCSTTGAAAEVTTQTKPIETTEAVTEETTQARPTETTEAVTEETTQARPTVTTESVTEETTQAKPTVTTEATTETTTQMVTEAATETTTVNTNNSMAQQLLTLVNQARAENGVSPLVLNDSLSSVAQKKAEDMKDNNYFSHTSPTYGSPFDMIKNAGISYTTAGENIAMGQKTAEAVFNAWMNSSGHRANILNASFTEMGVGVTDGSNIYWSQMFIG